MEKSLMVIFGFFELILRMLFVIVMSVFIIPLIAWLVDGGLEDIVSPTLWKKL